MPSAAEPGDRRGRPVLDRPPGDRYAGGKAAEPAASDGAASGAVPARGIAWAALVAIAGAALIVLLGGPLAVSLGLLVAAAVIGRYVALALAAGARTTVTGSPRRVVATSLAVGGVLLGQLGLWLFARSEGGVLGLVDYLGQTFGWLVPAQLLVAAIVAWLTARRGPES